MGRRCRRKAEFAYVMARKGCGHGGANHDVCLTFVRDQHELAGDDLLDSYLFPSAPEMASSTLALSRGRSRFRPRNLSTNLPMDEPDRKRHRFAAHPPAGDIYTQW